MWPKSKLKPMMICQWPTRSLRLYIITNSVIAKTLRNTWNFRVLIECPNRLSILMIIEPSTYSYYYHLTSKHFHWIHTWFYIANPPAPSLGSVSLGITLFSWLDTMKKKNSAQDIVFKYYIWMFHDRFSPKKNNTRKNPKNTRSSKHCFKVHIWMWSHACHLLATKKY